MKRYLIVIEQTQNSFSIYSPDLPGCVSTGKTPKETEENMRAEIEFHIEGLCKEGFPVPEPHTSCSYVELPA
jgi:predicted RNase H-like HicB family nuclease